MGRYYLHNDHEDDDDIDEDDDDNDGGGLSMITTAISFVYQPRHQELRHEEIEEIPNDDNDDGDDNGYQDMDCDDSYDHDDENDDHDYHNSQNTESERESDGDDDQQQERRLTTPTTTTSTALWTRSPATTHGGVTPVQHHYHVYVPPPSRQFSYCGRFFNSWFLVWIILVSYLIQRYGPPAPPPTIPEHTTWTDLFQHQYQVVSNLVKTWGHELPAHVSYWCWQGIRDDVHHTILPFISFSKNSNKCPWQVPTSPTAIQSQVVGQEIAVEHVFHAIQGWKQETPLLLYFTGRPGVGKRHLIKTLAHTLFGGCDEPPLLHLKSHSHDDYEYDTQPKASSLYQQTLDHVLDHSKPSVIVLEHVEQLPAGSFLHFVQQVQSSPAFHSTILIFTSNVGVRSMDRSIQRYGGDIASIPQAELQSYVAYEVGLFHNDENEDEGTANVSLLLDAIVPLFPLTHRELAQILKQQLRDVQLTPAATDSLLDHIEFQTWLHKTSGKEIFTFSPLGAKPIVNGVIFKSLNSKLEVCLLDAPSDSSTSAWVLQVDGPHYSLHQCPVSTIGDAPSIESSCVDTCRFTL